MANERSTSTDSDTALFDQFREYSLLEAILRRRSRRFAVGASMNGLLSYRSELAPVSLSELEETLLAVVAIGATGPTLPDDLAGGARDYTIKFAGRTYSSACASHGTSLFMSSDDGTYLVRPVAVEPIGETMATMGNIVARFRESRVQILDRRIDIPMTAPVTLPSNQWDLNKPGSTLFLPVTEITEEYINLLLLTLSPDNAVYIYDDMNGNAEPLAAYARPGMLHKSNSLPLSEFEQDVLQCTASTEQALMLQNVFLATQAIGLGGWLLSPSDTFTVFGGSPGAVGLGFRFHPLEPRFERPRPSFDARTTIPIGLDGYIEPRCPPYVDSMEEAVRAVYDAKWGSAGYCTVDESPVARNAVRRRSEVAAPSWVVDAVATLCDYIYSTYGRFPARLAPVQMSTWFQAHHLEIGYYKQYYPEAVLSDTVVDHLDSWHTGRAE